MAITRTAWTDDDGSGTTGTVINNAEKTTLYGQIDAAIDGADATTRTVAKGGTGATTLTAHGVVIGNGTSAVAITAVGATGTVLRGVTGADPAYGAVVLTSDVSGVLPVANGGWAAPGVSAPTTTGTSTALAIPAGVGELALFINNATLLTVQGIVAGLDGQLLTIYSKGAGQIDFAHQNGSATAANRLINFATSGSTSLAAGSGTAVYQYDLTTARWRLLAHDQGGWITRTFAAGNYTASAGNWTVASATRDAYWLKGRTLLFSENASGTTSGTPVTVKVALPAGLVSAAADTLPFYVQLNGAGGSEGGYVTTSAAGTLASYQRYANVAFAAGTVTVSGLLSFEVQ